MKELIEQCKCSVGLEANRHRDYYQSIESYINEINSRVSEPEIDEEMKKEMIEKDTIIELIIYPDTPIGSYRIYGTDYDYIIKQAKDCIK